MTENASVPFVAPVTFSALLSPMDDRSVVLEDGSDIAFRLVQRGGQVSGGPLAGTKMVEWGLHEIAPSYGEGQGVLVTEHTSGDKAYLKFEWIGRGVAKPDGSIHPVMCGTWIAIGGSGRFTDIMGAGTVSIDIPSEASRDWQFTGYLSL
jgi:hypothetical protein